MFAKYLAVFFITSDISIAFAQDCNPILCLYDFNRFFLKEDSDQCRKFGKLKQCVWSCSKLFGVYGNKFLDRLNDTESEICHDQETTALGEIWNDGCLDRVKFRFLSCFYDAWNKENVGKLVNADLLTCRKLMEMEKCPVTVLQHCQEETLLYVEKLLIKFLLPLKENNCKQYSLRDIWQLNMKSQIENINAFNNMFKCFDLHNEALSSCTPEKWTSNYIANHRTTSELCFAFNTFLKCVKNIVRKQCEADVSASVDDLGQSVFQSIFSACTSDNNQYNEDLQIQTGPTVLPDQNSTRSDGGALKLSKSDVNNANFNGNNNSSEIIIIHFGTLVLDKGVDCCSSYSITALSFLSYYYYLYILL